MNKRREDGSISPVLTGDEAVMLSIARSRYTLPSQLVFLAANAGGVLSSIIYNANTPNLYPNNAHHKVGWIVTWVVSAQVAIGLLARLAGAFERSGSIEGTMSRDERQTFIPVSTAALAEHSTLQQHHHLQIHSGNHRLSIDSGQGTERNTESLRSNSVSTLEDCDSRQQKESCEEPGQSHRYGDFEDEHLEEVHLPASRSGHSGRLSVLASKVAGRISSRAWSILLFIYNAIDRTVLILGFIAFALGIIAYGRFFVSGHPRPICWTEQTKYLGYASVRRSCTDLADMGIINRRGTPSSAAWHIGSRVVFSFGSVSSHSDAGPAASANGAG